MYVPKNNIKISRFQWIYFKKKKLFNWKILKSGGHNRIALFAIKNN